MPFLFLSPSTQAGNPYVTEGNERLWMNRIADRMEPYLRASGINVTRNDPEGTVGTSIRASNAGNYDFHLALHSNAAPPQSAGTVRGIDLYYYPGSTDGLRMANILADNLREIYPLPQRVRPLASTSITEIRRVRAPSVLAELGYHDNRAEAEWIVRDGVFRRAVPFAAAGAGGGRVREQWESSAARRSGHDCPHSRAHAERRAGAYPQFL